MQIFRCKERREWQIDITVGALRRIRDLAGVDLANPHQGDPPPVVQVDGDVSVLVDVLYAALKPQADQAGVDAEHFAAVLGGQALADGRRALWADMTLFFRESGREDVARLLERHESLMGREVAANVAGLDNEAIDRAFDAMMSKKAKTMLAEMQNLEHLDHVSILGQPSPNAPGSSGSTQAP